MAADFEKIKKEDCRTIARRLGLELNRQDKVRCFLHAGDKNPSLQVYADGWKCFGCGEHGDVIDLTAGLLGCSKAEAVRRLEADLGSGGFVPPLGLAACKRELSHCRNALSPS